MPIPQQQAKHNQQQQVSDATQAGRPEVWGVANSVEPDSQEEKARGHQHHHQQQQQQPASKRHQNLTVVTDADATLPPLAAAEAEADAGAGGAAIPMSPPSSPTHVVAAHSQDQLVVTTPVAADASTKSMDADVPQVVAPSPTSTAVPQGAKTVAITVAVANGAAAAATAPAPGPPAAPIRLGRGRKLCPNCKALTKSAVKQCRECKHIFNPVSQRLRAQLREPKDNEVVPMLPRRRHRPSQRLLESLVEPEEPSAAGGAVEGGGQSPSAPSRRPRSSAASDSSGDGKERGVASTPLAGGASSKEGQQQQQQAPKRSHKRKNPLPAGVAPPKRKKGAAAAARLAAAAAAEATSAADPGLAAGAGASTAARGILPILSLPEQQRVAQDLLASPTPARHTVPESPELAPMASPAGPLLFMASSAASNLSSGSLEDDSSWLSRSGSVGGGGGGGGGGGASVEGVGGGGSVSPTTAFVEQQLQQQQQQQQQQAARAVATSLPGLLLDDDHEDEVGHQQRQPEQQHVFAEVQDRDPFADVEMWWEGGGVAAVVNNPTTTVTAGVQPAFPMVGRDGTMQQRVVFPQSNSTGAKMELLGDAEDALLWNPLRASSSGGTAATAGTGTGTGAAAAAGRTLTLWPGSSNNDNHLLLSASSSSASTSSPSHLRGTPHRSPSPSSDNVVYPNFDRGAAIASAVCAPPTKPTSSTSACGGGSNAPGVDRHGSRADFLLAEASCSSLPEPLVFGGGDGTAVAAVSADSCGDGACDGAEEGAFWNPLFPAGGLGSS